ncbi:MAG: Non-specific protein-tyrosine kinase [Blastococcus sp.]|jgi:succinoglycan biosynthesis transport protein ExoP|nr:Non-specific protein-tyrosine kinase [Blastococcus sp.]
MSTGHWASRYAARRRAARAIADLASQEHVERNDSGASVAPSGGRSGAGPDPAAAGFADRSGVFGLNDVLRAVRAGRWLIVAGVAVGLAAGGVLSTTAERTYVSSSELFVSVARTPDAPSAYQGSLFTRERMDSYARLLTTSALAQRVVDDIGGPLDADEVADRVSAVPLPDTDILQITVTDTSPARAQAIGDSLGRQFTQQVLELETSDGAQGPAVQVTPFEPATFQPTPVTPEPSRYLVLGGALGLLLGLAAALLRQRLDRSVRTSHQVRKATGTALVSRLYEDKRLARLPLPRQLDGPSPATKGFRALRLNVEHAGAGRPRVLVVTSAAPGEGKSTVAVGLSVSLARSGSRVVLVEGNLWRPRLAPYLGVSPGDRGVTDVLAGRAAAQDVIVATEVANLALLPAGPMPEDPGELLGSMEMDALLQALRGSYDYVIVDATALLPLVDAAAVSALSDGCLLVTRCGKARQHELAEAATAIAAVNARLIGVVLNRVPVAAASPAERQKYRADSTRRTWMRPSAGSGFDEAPTDDPEPDVLTAGPGREDAGR